MTRILTIEQAIARAVLRDGRLTDAEFAAQQAVMPRERRVFRASSVVVRSYPPEPEVRLVPVPYDGPGSVSMAVW